MTFDRKNILVTICARQGSKGLPGKNVKMMLGKPLIAHTIEQALNWGGASRVVVSTDSEEIASVARKYGAEVPFLRPAELATDAAGKLPVITHALLESEKAFGARYDLVVDLDATAPLRRISDLKTGFETYLAKKTPICFSVVHARKSPYFNMVERGQDGKIHLVKSPPQAVVARQAAPKVWDMNASIYFYSREFLLSQPQTLWGVDCEIFEMSKESAFDIDEESDFIVTEALMNYFGTAKGAPRG